MKANPTPTTLRNLLVRAFDTGYEKSRQIVGLADEKYIAHQETMVDQATQSIQELIDQARIDEAHKAWTMIGNSHKGITANKLLKMQYERLTELKKGL